ncbi:hypothetical protein KVR01_012906 [Diaporthe batatas]|uniref:uncharacterized protein n=1 Tax=Diaporthe batatas TaxID=748121 RepID=UPI001D04E65A|nr:uncharacterized protein KVR01_012906 [Diaporthe batatas]KAG8157198.1 hypothetical protein KVR01_012906 [Diaporthe batatas]
MERKETVTITMLIYYTFMWIFNWVATGYYIHKFMEYDKFYALLLLLHVVCANFALLLAFQRLADVMLRDLDYAYNTCDNILGRILQRLDPQEPKGEDQV